MPNDIPMVNLSRDESAYPSIMLDMQRWCQISDERVDEIKKYLSSIFNIPLPFTITVNTSQFWICGFKCKGDMCGNDVCGENRIYFTINTENGPVDCVVDDNGVRRS